MPGAFFIDLFLFIPGIHLFLGLTVEVKVKHFRLNAAIGALLAEPDETPLHGQIVPQPVSALQLYDMIIRIKSPGTLLLAALPVILLAHLTLLFRNFVLVYYTRDRMFCQVDTKVTTLIFFLSGQERVM